MEGPNDQNNSPAEESAISASVLLTVGHNIEKLEKAFLFRRLDSATTMTNIMETISSNDILITPALMRGIFFEGLACFHFARQTNEEEWLVRGSSILETFKRWKELGSAWNFQNKVQLLQAEREYCTGDNESASASYEESIKSAHDHKFVHEEGIAHELYGHFNLERGHRPEALRSFNSSVKCYMSWGALAVARRVEDFIQSDVDLARLGSS